MLDGKVMQRRRGLRKGQKDEEGRPSQGRSRDVDWHPKSSRLSLGIEMGCVCVCVVGGGDDKR